MGKGGCNANEIHVDHDVVNPERDCSVKKSKESVASPWWIRGGMHVNLAGIAVNTAVPLFVFASDLDEQYVQVFLAALALNIFLASFAFKMRTSFCRLIVSAYMTSLILIFSLPAPARVLAVTLVLSIAKVGICMSACLHRYASHAAFKCGPGMQLVVSV